MAALYGANLDGVRSLLPFRDIDQTSKPSATQVTAWVEEGAAKVFARVGSLSGIPDDPAAELGGQSLRAHATKVARGAAHLYAASITEGAGHPELASPNDATAYAEWLRARYEEAVTELLGLVDRFAPGEGVPPEAGTNEVLPAYTFPPVTFADDMRF